MWSVRFLNLLYFAWLTSPCSLARQCALLWSETRKSLGYPLGTASQPDHLIVQKEVLEAAIKMVSLSQFSASFIGIGYSKDLFA